MAGGGDGPFMKGGNRLCEGTPGGGSRAKQAAPRAAGRGRRPLPYQTDFSEFMKKKEKNPKKQGTILTFTGGSDIIT